MARSHQLPPSAASLIASLRDIGYSLETAIADIIDNSISAGSTEIQVLFDLASSDPAVAIADNGHGMAESVLISAMRHGAMSPREQRGSRDLGRFGLGLKTASFSQCKRLTVVTCQDEQVAGAEWDLAQVQQEDDWVMSILDQQEIASQPFVELIRNGGTLVIWRNLDRMFEDESGAKRDEIVNEKFEAVQRHLALVYHRFLSGEVKGFQKLSIRMNGASVVAFDPFCRKNEATQILPEEKVFVNGICIVMQPYVLPHHSRLTATEYDYYQDRSDFVSNQGAYVYRNGRLMAWGDWFRLVPKSEATKLARVQIDFPNDLDEEWTIDIKKSRARPPLVVKERLRQIISRVTERSVQVHRGRGQKLTSDIESPLWERYSDREGIRYEVNTGHSLAKSISEKLSSDDQAAFDLLLVSIGVALPVETIYSDFAVNPMEITRSTIDESEVVDRLWSLRQIMYGVGKVDPLQFLQVVRSLHVFNGHEQVINQFIEEN